MRRIIEPPPSSKCSRCGGPLQLKNIDTTNSFLGVKRSVFSCNKCGNEQVYSVPVDIYTPRDNVRYH